MSTPALNLALDALEDAFGTEPTPDAIYEAFTSWATSTGRELYPHQEEALLATLTGAHLIVATPTGSGKSMVALAATFTALAHGRTAYYTAPLKALVSEKFFDLVRLFGAENVGMVTGDSTINAEAPIICATAEIVANMALRQGADAPIDTLIADEFHFYSEPDRGWAWQVPLLELTNTQHVLLSATLGDTTFFQEDLTRRTGRPVELIDQATRPVPLHFTYSYQPLPELIQELVATHQAPAYLVYFSQREAVSAAQSLLPIALVTKEEKARIADAIGDFRFGPGFGSLLSKLLRNGIGVHHAGLLPRYRRLVERLAGAGALKVICGTDTLGVGINVPLRTVVLTALSKFDGSRTRHLNAREFQQIAGRAGRAGFDTVGYVIAQAPEHEIENRRAIEKAAGDPKKLKKIVKRKPPEGAVLWSEKTFDYLKEAAPETLRSQMRITHAMILNLLERPSHPVEATIRLLTDNHDPKKESNPLIRQAVKIYSSLLQAGVLVHRDGRYIATHPGAPIVDFAHEVPEDFALNSPLAPFALAALEILDPASPTFTLDVISVIEAVQENPYPLLYAQQKQARGAAIGAMKGAGIGYEERMNEADKISWPTPCADLLHAAFETYSRTNPWVLGYELTPKSVVREMVENSLTFSELISRYDIARSEGVILRYLSDTYKALRQTLPVPYQTEEVQEIITWLGRLIRSVDSSLLDEWEALRDGKVSAEEIAAVESDHTPEGTEVAFGADSEGNVRFTANPYAVKKAIRTRMFQILEALEYENFDRLDRFAQAGPWPGAPLFDGDTLDAASADYFDEYGDILVDQQARSEEFFTLTVQPTLEDYLDAGIPEDVAATLETSRFPVARQVLCDPDGDNAWALWALIDLQESDERGELALALTRIGEQ